MTHTGIPPRESIGAAVPDQASGLRRLFDGRSARVLAVPSNPAVAWSGLLIERLIEALSVAGQHTLVIDAAETAPEPAEWASLDLRWAVEQRCDASSYLSARGLVRHHIDESGRAWGFLRKAAEAAPWADVLLVHAPVGELMRLMAGRDWRPMLLSDTTPGAVMRAYGDLKLMGRCGLSTFDVLMESGPRAAIGPRLALRLADSASRFLSWPMGMAVVVQGGVTAGPGERCRLQDLVRAQLAQAPTCAVHRSWASRIAH